MHGLMREGWRKPVLYSTKMKARMGLALAVMMAMALGHVKAGRIEQMRSLVQPIPIRNTS